MDAHVEKVSSLQNLSITLNIYFKGERNKIVFIYFDIIMHFSHEDKFCQRVAKTKLYVTLANVME